jgi:hypothetical protein
VKADGSCLSIRTRLVMAVVEARAVAVAHRPVAVAAMERRVVFACASGNDSIIPRRKPGELCLLRRECADQLMELLVEMDQHVVHNT